MDKIGVVFKSYVFYLKKIFNFFIVWIICIKFDKEFSSFIEEVKNVRSNLEIDGWADRWRIIGDKEKFILIFGLSELIKLYLRMIIEYIKYVGFL